jgi:hypothetical protein
MGYSNDQAFNTYDQLDYGTSTYKVIFTSFSCVEVSTRNSREVRSQAAPNAGWALLS